MPAVLLESSDPQLRIDEGRRMPTVRTTVRGDDGA